MDMHLETAARGLISSYDVGVLGIDGRDYHDNILVAHGRVIERWFDGPVAELEPRHFDPLFETARDVPDICLLGTGREHVFPPMSLLAALRERGVALEVMNTRAACRTYSVLVNEERTVAAALLQIER